MNENWRQKSSSRLKKRDKNYFNFSDEDTTFDNVVSLEEPSSKLENVDVISDEPNKLTVDLIASRVNLHEKENIIQPERNSELSTNKASIEHQILNSKAPDKHQLSTKENDQKPIEKLERNSELSTNKASIEHQILNSKAPDKYQLSINSKNTFKLSINKHQLSINKALDKALDKHQLSTNSEVYYYQLVGLEKEFIEYIYGLLQNAYSFKTESISTELLSVFFKKTPNRIRTLIQRLVEKKLLKIENSSRGKSSWRIFSLNEKIFNEISLNNSIRHQLSTNKVSILASTLASTFPSKIDSIYNNTNYLTGELDANGIQTPSQQQAQNLGWLKSLNFSAIPYIKPMMVNSAIRTLVETKLDPDDVQMFINKFKNWLVTQNKIQNPLAIFCDKLKEYANEGDSPVLAVMSDEEIQVEYLMAQDLEKKRAEMDLINKARTFKQEQDKEALFQEWLSQASEEEKKSLYPETSFAKFGSDIYTIGLKDAFLNQN